MLISHGVAETATGFFNKLFDILENFAMNSGLRLIAAIAVLIIGFRLAKWINKNYTNSKAFAKVSHDIQGILRWVINFLLHAAVVILVIAILGISLTSVATIISSAAVALGLALQGSLSNLAGGLMILVFKPFHIGDFVEASGFSGNVESIGVFYTALKTPDNRRIVMPNAALSNTNLTNYSVYDTRRVDIIVSAGTAADSETVKKVALDIISREKLALHDPKPFVRLNDCTDGKLNYTVRVWCKAENYFDLYNNLQEHLRDEFVKNGIAPAFNTIKVVKE